MAHRSITSTPLTVSLQPDIVRVLTLGRYFKKKVYETNHSNVEKVLLGKVNLQMTTRLLLQNAFHHRDGNLTAQVNRLYGKCPTLFDSVLPRMDRRDMLGEDELDNEMDIHFGADRDHCRPTVIGAIPHNIVRKTISLANGGRPLPRRDADMSAEFKQRLRRAYVEQYGMDEVYQFGRQPIQYSNKFAFTDR